MAIKRSRNHLLNKANSINKYDGKVADILKDIIRSSVNIINDGTPSTEGHEHDDRYYTETEISEFLSGAIAKTGYNKLNWDNAFGWGNHADVGYLTVALAASTYVALAGSYSNPSWLTSLPWSKITGTPATYAPSPHTHTTTDISNLSSYTGFDSRYYTETEINSLLSAKENSISFGTALQYYRGDKTWQTLNTSAVPEGANLYFTDARADARINAMKAVANGLATLDAFGRLNTSQLPAVAITDTFVVASQAAMLALSVETGDVAVRTDLNKSFILKGTNPALLSEWTELLTPTDNVLSVNGQTGIVNLNTGHIPEGSNLYYTNARVKTYADTLYSALGHTHTTADISNLSSYTGFDARYHTETEIGSFFSGGTAITGYNKSNWDSAFGWGNHASAGYLTTALAASTYASLSGSYANPTWITSLAWAKITGAPSTYAPSAHTLDSHSNVTITSNTNGEILRWNGTAWINNTLAEAGIQAAGSYAASVHTHTTAEITNLASYTGLDVRYFTESESDARFVALAGAYSNPSWITALDWAKITGAPSTFTPSAHTLDSHSNVTITANTAGEILKWDGTAWINNTLAEAGIQAAGSYAASSHTHTTSDITNLASYTGLDARYFTESESDARFVAFAGSYANPSWITSLAWSKITGVPTLNQDTTGYAGYLRMQIIPSVAGGTDMNTITSGLIQNYGSGAYWTNAAGVAYGFGYTQKVSSSMGYQFMYDIRHGNTNYGDLYFRTLNNSTTWSGWGRIWHSLNDGVGSGLDSDLLDAQHGSYYLARANHTGTQLASTISDLASYTGLDVRYFTETESDARFVALAGSYANPSWITALAWNKLTGVPSTFTPSAHTHVKADITDFAHTHAYGDLTGIPSTFTPSAHTLDSHSNVTITTNTAGEILKWDGTAWINNTLAEAGIQAAGSYAASVHTHTTADISNLASYTGLDVRYFTETESDARFVALAGAYANPTWISSLAWAKITGTPATYAPSAHTHAYGDLTGIPSTFTPSAHTLDSHSNVTITTNTAGEILKWDGTAWINNTLAEAGIQAAGSYAAASHTHTTADITNLASYVGFDARYFTESESDARFVALAGSYANPTWITSLAWAKITGAPGTYAPSAHTLDSHSNVTITSNTNGEILRWNGTAWINNTLAEAGIQAAGSYAASVHTHTTTDITNLASYTGLDVRYFTETESDARFVALAGAYANPTWISSLAWAKITGTPATYAPSAHTHAYGDLTGIPSTFTPSAHTLDSHSNVTITTNTAGEILKWDGTAWINNTLAEAGIQAAGSYAASVHTHTTADITNLASYTGLDARYFTETESDARFVALAGSYANPTWITSLAWAKITGAPGTYAPSAHTLDSHSNVTITSNTNGEILRWNGTAWINNTLAEAGIQAAGSYAALSHTHTTADITNLSSYTGFDARYYTESEINTIVSNYVTINYLEEVLLGNVPVTGYNNVDWDTAFSWGDHSAGGYASTFGSYSNPSWITSLAWAKITGAPSTYAPSAHTLDSHSNVTITSNTNGEILRWNGSAWINNTLAEAGIQASGSYAALSHTHTTADITNLSSYTGFDARYYTESEIVTMLTNYVTNNTAQTINVNKSFGPTAGSYTRAFFHVTGAAGATAAMFGTTYPIALGGNYPGVYFNTYYNAAWKLANGTGVYGAGITFNPLDGIFRVYQMATTANADATISPQITMSLSKEGNLTAIGQIEAWGKLITKSTIQTELYPGAGSLGPEWNLADVIAPAYTDITANIRVWIDGVLYAIHATEVAP